MTPGEIEAIERACAKATPGPWRIDDYDMYVFAPDDSPVASTFGECWQIRGHGAEVSGRRPVGSQDANGAFIAGARAWVPQLLARIAELEADNVGLARVAAVQRERAAAVRLECDEARACAYRMASVLEVAYPDATSLSASLELRDADVALALSWGKP
jgi:hypothetical protein